jgi:threo-3-hydroxy-L-aspartate ammonia-lyase
MNAADSVDLVSVDAIREAASRIAPVIRRTPLLPAATDGRHPGFWLKCENFQVAGAFKIRGAANMVRQLDPEALRRGVITYSSGNHGQALACVAAQLGVTAVIVMPTTAPPNKVAGARAFGAEVVLAGTTSADRKHEAERLSAERGLAMVPPFDHPWIIAGQGTLGLEILEEVPEATDVFVPVGGGGLLSGVAAAVKRIHPATRVIGVEPTGAAKMTRSLEVGAPVTLEHTSSIADGLLPVRPGDLTFAHVRALVDEVVTVTDEAIADAVQWLARESHVVAEPSGAASVAAALARPRARGGEVVAIVSGGNVSPSRLAELMSRR